MRLTHLRIRDLRGIAAAELDLHPGLNLFVGSNGAGKTSVLEAMHLLSYGRSFRRGPRSNLVRRGAAGLSIYAEVERDRGVVDRLGLAIPTYGELDLRLNGQPGTRLSELLLRCAVCCHEPGSHELIAGPAELRRAYADWSLFHVEPGFWTAWRRYQRALQQRNALLRQGGAIQELRPWDQELIQQGTLIAQWRTDLLRRKIEPALARNCSSLVPELGVANLTLDPGWPGSEDAEGLSTALAARMNRDRERRQTGVGPHRADWRIRFEHAPVREQLSRGQEKLVALACALAQAEVLEQQTGEWPIFCLDDLPSELDLAHSELVIQRLRQNQAQVMVTGTHFSPELAESMRGGHMFHVEHGALGGALTLPAA